MRWVYLLLLFVALGLIGAFPALLLFYFFSLGQAALAWEIYGLGALILASWFPLKAFIDSRVKQQPFASIFPQQINSLALSFAFVAFLFLIPVLYINTALTFLMAILVYSMSNFPIALLLALLVQAVFLYRGAQQEKALGVNNSVFVRFNSISLNDDMVIDAERQSPRPYESEMLILPPLLEDSFEEDESAEDDDNVSQSSSSDSY